MPSWAIDSRDFCSMLGAAQSECNTASLDPRRSLLPFPGSVRAHDEGPRPLSVGNVKVRGHEEPGSRFEPQLLDAIPLPLNRAGHHRLEIAARGQWKETE